MSSADAGLQINLEAPPGTQESTSGPQSTVPEQEGYTPLYGSCKLPYGPADTDDSEFERTPSYQRFSVYNICLGILFFAPLIAVCGYLNVVGKERCKHPRLNNFVTATLTVYAGDFTKMTIKRYFDREWQGTRAVYFRNITMLVSVFVGAFVGASLSLWALDECN